MTRAFPWSSASRSTWWSSGVQPGSREHARLSPAAAETLAPHPRLGHRVGRTQHERPDRCAQPLGQADARGVGARGQLRESDAGGDVRVPDPCPVEMDGRPRVVGQRAQATQHPGGWTASAGEVVGVLDRDGRCRDEERPEVGGERARRWPPGRRGRGVGPGAHRQPGDRPVGTELGPRDVRRGLAQHLLADTDERPDGQQVGQRSGDGEQRRLEAEQLRDPLLEPGDARVLAVDVVADLGRRHRRPHRRRSGA